MDTAGLGHLVLAVDTAVETIFVFIVDIVYDIILLLLWVHFPYKYNCSWGGSIFLNFDFRIRRMTNAALDWGNTWTWDLSNTKIRQFKY